MGPPVLQGDGTREAKQNDLWRKCLFRRAPSSLRSPYPQVLGSGSGSLRIGPKRVVVGAVDPVERARLLGAVGGRWAVCRPLAVHSPGGPIHKSTALRVSGAAISDSCGVW